MRGSLVALVAAVALTATASAPVRAADDGVRRFLDRLQGVVRLGDGAAFDALLGGGADRTRAAAFAAAELAPGMTRAVVQELDRSALPGALPGDGYSLVVDVFEQYATRARISTWLLDIRRAGNPGSPGEWAIADEARLSSIEDLYRLSLDATRRFTVHGLTITDEDLDLSLEDGSAFVADIDQGTTALVFVGRGTMRFHPAPATEQTQVRIFSGADGIDTPVDAVYLRLNPDDFERLIAQPQLVAAAPDPNELRRADRIFHDDSQKSYTVDIGDLSDEAWSLVPSPRDLVAEIHTRRFDTLTYSHANDSAEDISLFDRARRKTIAMYASRLNAGRNDPGGAAEAPFTVGHYDIDVSLAPDRRWLEGRAKLSIRVGANPLSTLTLRLAEPLAVSSVVSDLYGRLFSMRVNGQSSLLVSLPGALIPGSELTLTVAYAGRLDPQSLDAETIAMPQRDLSQRDGPPPDEPPLVFDVDPSFVYSNQNDWYPRPAGNPFATATIRVAVPAAMGCVATGVPDAKGPVTVPAKDPWPVRRLYTFTAAQPVRYLAFAVGRFAAAQKAVVTFPTSAGADVADTLAVSVQANRANTGRGRELRDRAIDIVRFYESLLGDAPYDSVTIALTESKTPGGHSPAYFAVLDEPPPAFAFEPRSDPAWFDRYPDFFLAHELAHQWWGQAVGWRTYHDQWLSEAFAQYFAALYAQHRAAAASPGAAANQDVFYSMLRQMRRWAADDTAAGPISLGYRLGHIQGDSRIYRALVYDKGALVLHMLRGLVGDDVFFGGLRSFYAASRFRSAGTEDFRAAMEAAAGRPLARFFDRWIYGATLPRLAFSYRIDGGDVVLHVDQIGDIFDVPITVTLQYADRSAADIVIRLDARSVDQRVRLAGTLRSADISKDDSPLADIVRN
jgi:hypothetical protein